MQLTIRIASVVAYYFETKPTSSFPGPAHKASKRVKQTPKILEKGRESSLVAFTRIDNEPNRSDCSGSPSQESIFEPAATRHAPYTEMQRVKEKSKHEHN